MSPLRVAPGNPAKGVKPILQEVSGISRPGRQGYEFNRVGCSRGVNGFALLDGAYGRPASEVHHDQIRLLFRLAQELRHRAQNECVTDPVEAILAQPFGPRGLLIDRVRSHVLRDCLVKRRVEECYAPDMCQFLAARADDFQGGEVVPVRECQSANVHETERISLLSPCGSSLLADPRTMGPILQAIPDGGGYRR